MHECFFSGVTPDGAELRLYFELAKFTTLDTGESTYETPTAITYTATVDDDELLLEAWSFDGPRTHRLTAIVVSEDRTYRALEFGPAVERGLLGPRPGFERQTPEG